METIFQKKKKTRFLQSIRFDYFIKTKIVFSAKNVLAVSKCFVRDKHGNHGIETTACKVCKYVFGERSGRLRNVTRTRNGNFTTISGNACVENRGKTRRKNRFHPCDQRASTADAADTPLALVRKRTRQSSDRALPSPPSWGLRTAARVGSREPPRVSRAASQSVQFGRSAQYVVARAHVVFASPESRGGALPRSSNTLVLH